MGRSALRGNPGSVGASALRSRDRDEIISTPNGTSRNVFVDGLHRSGTSLIHNCLRDHSDVSGFSETGVIKDEGQYLQTVYPLENSLGGPGRMGFHPAAHRDEASPLVSEANARKLLGEWGRHWDLSKPVLLEKTPMNLLQTRFLQALFPGSRFIIVSRHPIAASYATKKWARDLLVHRLIEHWLICHERFGARHPTSRKCVGRPLRGFRRWRPVVDGQDHAFHWTSQQRRSVRRSSPTSTPDI